MQDGKGSNRFQVTELHVRTKLKVVIGKENTWSRQGEIQNQKWHSKITERTNTQENTTHNTENNQLIKSDAEQIQLRELINRS